jgi:hypothetical protein
VSPSYRTPEQYERWHVRDCARCGRRADLAANWPDGPLCRTCYHKAARTRGCCPGCGASRLLPGRRADQAPICRDCAAITRDFFCDRCGFEGLLLGGRQCEHCTLASKLTAALDDGTGHVSAALTPLFDAVTAMTKPQAGLDWLSNNPQVGQNAPTPCAGWNEPAQRGGHPLWRLLAATSAVNHPGCCEAAILAVGRPLPASRPVGRRCARASL